MTKHYRTKKQLLHIFFFALILGNGYTYAQNIDIDKGLKIINLVRANYGEKALTLDYNLSNYAIKKAQQQVESLSGEITIQKTNMVFYWILQKVLEQTMNSQK